MKFTVFLIIWIFRLFLKFFLICKVLIDILYQKVPEVGDLLSALSLGAGFQQFVYLI